MIETLEEHRDDRETMEKELSSKHKLEIESLETELLKECNTKMKTMHKGLMKKYEEVLIAMNSRKDEQCLQYLDTQKSKLEAQYGN